MNDSQAVASGQPSLLIVEQNAPAPEHWQGDVLPFFIETLRFIEEQKGVASLTMSGAQGKTLGELLICDGRIALGRLPASGALTRYLAERDPAVAKAVQEVLMRARQERRSLVATLGELMEGDSAIIRDAIIDQIAVGLSAIEQQTDEDRIMLRLVRSERIERAPLRAFPSAAEVYWRTVERLYPQADDAARRSFEDLNETAPMALLCSRSKRAGEPALPVAGRGIERLMLRNVLELAMAIETLSSQAVMLGAGALPASGVFRNGSGALVLVATRKQVAVFLGLDGESCARSLGRIQRTLEKE